jgi:glycine/D-amino acid oxidase-like deaminating enzyme
LEGDRRTDVAIIGGGFAGLWAAYHLKTEQPSLEVAVLEQEVAGYGASGRNGGFAMTLLGRSLHDLREQFGPAEALEAHKSVAAAVDSIGRFGKENAVDFDYEKNGVITVSTMAWQDATIENDVKAAQEMGIQDVRFLDGEAVRDMVHSPTYRCGHEERACAILNPAKLAWGLARVIRKKGVALYEGTLVREVRSTEGAVQVQTEGGLLRADKVVLATNAYSVHFPHIARWVMPLYTYIVLTEPLTPDQWDSIGWKGRQGIEDRLGGFHYYRPTVDGRIAWGGEAFPYHYRSGIGPQFDQDEAVFARLRESFAYTFPMLSDVKFTHAWGGEAFPYHYRSGIGPQFDQDEAVFARLRESFAYTFPMLSEVKFTHAWGGPVGITIRFVPTFGTLEGGRVHYGVGHCGHGVAPTYVGGEILRDLVLDRETERTNLCFVKRQAVAFPGEPLRYLATASTLRYMERQDRSEKVVKPPFLMRLVQRFEARQK